MRSFPTRRSSDLDVETNDIIVTNGGSEALLFTFSVIANPGDEIIIPEPFYANYNSFACQSDVKIVPVRSTIENNFGLPPIASFEDKITSKTKAILICHPRSEERRVGNECVSRWC